MSTENWDRPMEPGPVKITHDRPAPTKRHYEVAMRIVNLYPNSRNWLETVMNILADYEQEVLRNKP